MHKIIRLLVVDDNALMRKMVIQQMRDDPNIHVVGEAATGVEALAMVRQHTPDVVVMDVRMPVMSGIEATHAIMAQRPVPILIFSSFTTEGAPDTVAALAAGAVEAIPKDGIGNTHQLSSVLHDRVVYWGQQKLNQSAHHIGGAHAKPTAPVQVLSHHVDLVVVAVSTGGPNAFPAVLTAAGSLSCPMVVAQHMSGEFTGVYARHLAATCKVDVVEGRDGDKIAPHTVTILPGSADWVVDRCPQGGFVLRKRPLSSDFAHPSADILFESALKAARSPLAVVMTGMGKDGSRHMGDFAQRKLPVLVQAPKTCVVDAMPQAVIQLNAATHVVPLDELGKLLRKYCNHTAEGQKAGSP